MPAATLIGKWTYRSFLNNPAPTDGDPQKLADLLFAEAVFTFQLPTSGTLYLDSALTIPVTAGS